MHSSIEDGSRSKVAFLDTYEVAGLQAQVDQLGAADLFSLRFSAEDLLSLVRSRLPIAATDKTKAVA